MRALGVVSDGSATSEGGSELVPFEAALRDLQGRVRRTQREHGIWPSQACFILAQRWHTGRRSAVMARGLVVRRGDQPVGRYVDSPNVEQREGD